MICKESTRSSVTYDYGKEGNRINVVFEEMVFSMVYAWEAGGSKKRKLKQLKGCVIRKKRC